MVSDAVELERVDVSDSTPRFHQVGGRVIVEVIGEVPEMGWSPKSQKVVLLVGEALSEQDGRTVESMDHTPNVLGVDWWQSLYICGVWWRDAT